MTRRRVLSIQSDRAGMAGGCATQTVLKVMATITPYNLAGYISTLGTIDGGMYLFTCESRDVLYM
jgi:hypothetical protein